MTINDPNGFVAGLWDWQILDGCFGDTHIKPTDCEGLVERNSRFLYLETKRPGASIPEGQERMFENMRLTGLFTVFVIWGIRNKPEKIKVYTRHQANEVEPCDLDRLRSLVSRWFSYADNQF